jgi:hypothetical protein
MSLAGVSHPLAQFFKNCNCARVCPATAPRRQARRADGALDSLSGELVLVDQTAEPVTATEPVERKELGPHWFVGRWR